MDKYERAYGLFAKMVTRSMGRVGRAAQAKDPAVYQRQKARHEALMAGIRQVLANQP